MTERYEKLNNWSPSTVHTKRTVVGTGLNLFRSSQNKWLLALILGLGAGITGPFGTYDLYSIVVRIAYWEVVIVAGFAIWWIIEAAMVRAYAPGSYALRRIAIIVPFAALNSAYVIVLHLGIEAFTKRPIPVGWTELFISHLILSVTVIFPAILIVRKMRLNLESQAGGEAIRFLTEKLPAHLRGEAPFALAAEGHYVRVHTPLGDDLVTMRFEDACHAVAGINGLQVHRSWWIALDYVETVQPLGSAYEAALSTGLKVPVGRRRKPTLMKKMKTSPRVA